MFCEEEGAEARRVRKVQGGFDVTKGKCSRGAHRNVSIKVQACVFDTVHLYPISLFSPSCALSRVQEQ